MGGRSLTARHSPGDEPVSVHGQGLEVLAKLAEARADEPTGGDDDVLAVVGGKDGHVVGEGEHFVLERTVQVAGELLGPLGQVRAADAVDKDRVPAQHGAVVHEVHRRTLGVPGRVEDRHGQPAPSGQSETVSVGERRELEGEGVRRVEVQRRAGARGQRTST